jgi:hypothetical protein
MDGTHIEYLHFVPVRLEMARKRFKGDATHRLPEGMMAPYILWFTALQLAPRTPGLMVNKRFYGDWGKVEGVSFNDWWEDKWRDLFAVSIGVREIEGVEDFKRSQDNTSLIVRIPLDQDFKKTIEELKETYEVLPAKKRLQKPQGKFHLTGTSKLRLVDLRRYLKSYEFKLEGHSYKEITFRYCEWADNWDKKRGKRPPVNPGGWRKLLEAIERGEDIYADHPAYRSARRMVARGRKIVENTARGEFPGKY